jgi:hypothetical protein
VRPHKFQNIYMHIAYVLNHVRQSLIMVHKDQNIIAFNETNTILLCLMVIHIPTLTCHSTTKWIALNTRWFKYDRDKLWLVYTQIVPVIFEPPCSYKRVVHTEPDISRTHFILTFQDGRCSWMTVFRLLLPMFTCWKISCTEKWFFLWNKPLINRVHVYRNDWCLPAWVRLTGVCSGTWCCITSHNKAPSLLKLKKLTSLWLLSS